MPASVGASRCSFSFMFPWSGVGAGTGCLAWRGGEGRSYSSARDGSFASSFKKYLWRVLALTGVSARLLSCPA